MSARPDDLRRMYESPASVSARDLMRAAERRGWELARIGGSHHIHRKASRRVSIPLTARKNGTKRGIIRTLMEGGE